jgi:hypothetical protein
MKQVFFLICCISFALCIVNEPFLPTLGVGASDLNILNLVGQFCQGTGAPYQCGAGNCECWTTGNQNGGSNSGRINCNAQGQFCDGSSCYYPCMDKSPDTKIAAFQYGSPSSQGTIPDAVFTHYIDNFGDSPQTGSYQFSESVQNSYSWSWSSTVSISNTLTVDVGLPDICTIHDAITMSVSTTQGETFSKSTTKTWSTTLNYNVAGKQRIRLDYIVSRVNYIVPFTMSVEFGGQVAYWCSNQVDGHWFWMPSVAEILQGQSNCSGNVCTLDGVFTGMQ